MNVEAAPPVVASLVNYGSDTDMESDLEPPPSTQVPRGYYDTDICRAAALARTPTSHSTILATSVKRKLGDMEDGLTDDDAIEDALPEDDLLEDDVIEDDQIGDDFMADDDFVIEEDTPSSDVEFVGHSKPVMVKTESEPVSLRVTSAVVSFGYLYSNHTNYESCRLMLASNTKLLWLSGQSLPSHILAVFPVSRVLLLAPCRTLSRWRFSPVLLTGSKISLEVLGQWLDGVRYSSPLSFSRSEIKMRSGRGLFPSWRQFSALLCRTPGMRYTRTYRTR